MAEERVAGGASKALAWVLRMVGDSVEVERLRVEASLCVGGDGGIAVWSESFGRFSAEGLVDGITDSIAPVACFRSSEVWGGGS